jgi:hypothetical protein
MALLVDVAEVRERLGWDATDEFDAAIAGALEYAGEQIATSLRTTFDQRTGVVDTFLITGIWGPYGARYARLMTSVGFLTSAPTARIAATSADLPNVAALDSSYLTSNLERGLVTLRAEDLEGQTARLTYNAGFSLDTDDDYEIYVGVPNWLKQAAIAAAVLQLAVTKSEHMPSSFTPDDKAALRQHVSRTLSARVRMGLNADYPV